MMIPLTSEVVLLASLLSGGLALAGLAYARAGLRINDANASSSRRDNALDGSQIFQKLVCFNQGAFLQFLYLTSQLHREAEARIRSASAKGRSEEVRDLQRRFVSEINQRLVANTVRNFEFVHYYFAQRDRIRPRVCLKLFIDSESSGRQVVTAIRDRAVDYSSDSEIWSNSGFEHVCDTGTYFFENDLPLAVANRRYQNQRLRCSPAATLDQLDVAWTDLWHGGSAYRSTLIVPLTLWNNELDGDFREKFGLPADSRSIFGLLCMDHEKSGYFDERSDVGFGYVVADLLSQFLFTHVMFVNKSNTMQPAACEHLPICAGDAGMMGIGTNLQLQEFGAFKVERSAHNHLVSFGDAVARVS